MRAYDTGRFEGCPPRRHKFAGGGSHARVLVLCCLLLCAQTGGAAPGPEAQQVDPRDFPKASYHEGLAAVRLGDQYGYIDRSGQVVISPRFQFAQIFSEVDYQYVPAHGFEDGYARVTTLDGREGYIDHAGKFSPIRPTD